MELGTMISQLGIGMITSIEIFVLTLVFSLPLGLLVAFGRMSKIAPLRWFTKIYISIMRGTPLMLQLMVVFFGPYYIFGMRLSAGYRMTAVLIEVGYLSSPTDKLNLGSPTYKETMARELVDGICTYLEAQNSQ